VTSATAPAREVTTGAGWDGAASPHLLLVAPNVLAVRRQMDLDMLDLPAWVCLHEMTHAVQLAAAPWLGPYLSDSMRMVIGAVVEAVDAGVRLLVVITEGIPVADATWMRAYAADHGVQIIGPNCPGIISPARSNVGITPPDITGPGPLGLVSKSGTLTYQLMHELSDLGFTTCIGIGGDPVVGTTHIDALAAFEADPDTRLVVMIGEIGGDAEERAAAYIREHMTKPVVAYVAGFTAPEGRTMGHAGAIVSGSSGTAEAKKIALEAAGVRVGRTPSQTAEIARELYHRLAGEVSA